jgi:hypothetical protein
VSDDADRPQLLQREGRGFVTVVAARANDLQAFLRGQGVDTREAGRVAGHLVELEVAGEWDQRRVQELVDGWWRFVSMASEHDSI